MPYTPPNTFLPSTSVNATLIQQNDDALKSYIDGGVQVADVSSTTWVRAPHIMRGTYIPNWNLHEFTTGIVRGGFYDTSNVVASADKYRTSYPAFKTNNQAFVIEFIPETTSFTYHLSWQVYPKHVPLVAGSTTTNNIAETTVGTDYGAYTCNELDQGHFRADGGFTQGTVGLHRRRPIQNWKIETVVGATPGVVNRISFYIGSNIIVNDFAELNYSLEVYYN